MCLADLVALGALGLLGGVVGTYLGQAVLPPLPDTTVLSPLPVREFASLLGPARPEGVGPAATFADVLRGSEATTYTALAGIALSASRPGHPEDAELISMIRKAGQLSSRRRIGAQADPAVARVVRSYAGQVQYCYAEELTHRSTLSGRLDLELRVYAGEVVDVLVATNTTRDTNLEACVVRKLRRWRFDSALDADVVLPFELSSDR